MESELRQLLSPRYRLLSHLLFWFCYWIFFSLLHGSFYEAYSEAFIEVASVLPARILATYFTLYILLPQFLYKKKYLDFFIWLILSAIAFGYLDRIVLAYTYIPIYLPDYDFKNYPLTHAGKALKHMISVYSIVFTATAIKLVKRNYQNEQLAQALGKEKLDAELKFLKAQVHPHFLFNTLNNLYALTLQNSPKSPEVVLKLSNLLDYMLYECNGKSIPIHKEIQQIHNFIELEKLRYGDRLEVSFTSNGVIQDQKIPPLLLLPFIENAFKHGVSKNLDETFVSIDLSIKENYLFLKVENSKATESNPVEEAYTKGIGLKNVRRRLDLLYEEDYSLKIFPEEETFLIILKLPILESYPTPTEALVLSEEKNHING